MSPSAVVRRRLPLRRPSFLAFVVIAALVALCMVWLAYRVMTVRQALLAAQSHVASLRGAIADGAPPARHRELLTRATADVERARAAARDPLWSVASHVPVAGQPLRTVRGLADTTYRLSRGPMPALLASAADLDRARRGPTGGAVPLEPLERAAGPLRSAAVALAEEHRRAAALPGSWFPPVAAARKSLVRQLGQLDRQTNAVQTAVRLAPDMLGANGVRRYFVAFENPAESRGGGGLVGAYAIVEAFEGKVQVARLGPDSELRPLTTPPPGLDPEWLANYGQYDAGTLWANTNLSPHFPSTGTAWAAMYRQLTGVQVDGALRLDPVALAALLRATGPVVVAGAGSVSADNVVDFIEKDEYALPLSDEQRKDVLTSLGKAAVERLLGGQLPGQRVIAGLADAAQGGHLQLMSLHPEQQARLAEFPIAGVLPRTPAPFAQVLITNASANKLDYYLRDRLQYRVDDCDSSGRRVTLTVRLSSDAPTTPLPPYASGRGDKPDYPVEPNQNRVLMSLFLTDGARFVSATIDGQPVGLQPGEEGSSGDVASLDPRLERGHPVLSTFIEVKPKQERRLLVTVIEPPSALDPLLPVQPLPNRPTVTQSGRTACPA